MVISQFFPIIGGAEKQAQLLSRKLTEKGVKVRVVTGWWKWGTPRKERIDGIPVFRNFSFWGMFGIKGIRPIGVLIYMITLAFYLIFHRSRYDLIHVHQILYPAFVSVFFGKKILKKPILAKIGCTGLTSDIKNIKRFPLGRYQLNYILKHLDRLITTNQEGFIEFKALGYPEKKIEHIPNGVSISLPQKTGVNPNHLNVITAVRLDHQKGIDILLKALPEVLKKEKKIRLLILGQGPLEKKLRQLALSLNIDQFIDFVGLVNDPENYFINSDIFILPSRAEGMSNALLEAMCAGLACIATNIEGNKELISDHRNFVISRGDFQIAERGILINPDDVGALSKAILYLVGHFEKREELGKNARKFIRENYSIDKIADRYIELYQHMLNRES